MECLRQEEVLALLRVESTEKPKLVPLDWAADVKTGVNLGEAVRSRAGEREVLGLAHQALGSDIPERIAAELVATALGDNVENSACALTVLSAVSAGLDFNFLHKLKRQVRTRSAESWVGSGYAVKNVVVLWARG